MFIFRRNMEKPQRKSKKPKNSDDEDNDFIPENGLYDENGSLFYHCTVKPLTKAQLARAAAHGVNLSTRNQSTLEETLQIVENWRKFAEENQIKLEKAPEYLTATASTGKHLLQHQRANNFWPKLCSGLPHLSANRVKQRAVKVMTADFIKDLKWDDPGPQIQEQFFVPDTWTELELQKGRELMERGCSVDFIAETMEMSQQKTIGLLTKLRKLDIRADADMMASFFLSAVDCGLDVEELKARVEDGCERDVLNLEQKINFKDLALTANMTEMRTRQFMKGILMDIRNGYRNRVEKGEAKDAAFDQALRFVSAKPPLTETQVLQALELMCFTIRKSDTAKTMLKNKELANLIKNNGITGFSCYMPEYRFLYTKITHVHMNSLKKHIFFHLRREFSFRLQMHCLFWGWKRLAVWDHLPLQRGESVYSAVIRHESTNPFRSKMTMKFLENRKVAEWIMEDHLRKQRCSNFRKRDVQIEAFILYCHLTYGSKFKFPAKLCRFLSGTSKTIESVLNEDSGGDPDNSEYLSTKQAEKRLKKATETETIVGNFRNKSAVVKMEEGDDGESNDDETKDDEPNQLIRVLEDIKFAKAEAIERRRREIDEFIRSADLENAEIRKGAKRRVKGELKYKSKEFVEDSDSDSDDEEKYENPENSEQSGDDEPTRMDLDSEAPEALEDVPEEAEASESTKKKKKKKKKRRNEDLDELDISDVDSSEEYTKKSKRRRLLEAGEQSEDVKSEKQKKKERRRSESEQFEMTEGPRAEEGSGTARKRKVSDVPMEDVVEDSEAERRRHRKEKKAEKRRKRAEEQEQEEDVEEEAPEDVEDSEAIRKKSKKSKKKKKKERQEIEDEEEDVE